MRLLFDPCSARVVVSGGRGMKVRAHCPLPYPRSLANLDKRLHVPVSVDLAGSHAVFWLPCATRQEGKNFAMLEQLADKLGGAGISQFAVAQCPSDSLSCLAREWHAPCAAIGAVASCGRCRACPVRACCPRFASCDCKICLRGPSTVRFSIRAPVLNCVHSCLLCAQWAPRARPLTRAWCPTRCRSARPVRARVLSTLD